MFAKITPAPSLAYASANYEDGSDAPSTPTRSSSKRGTEHRGSWSRAVSPAKRLAARQSAGLETPRSADDTPMSLTPQGSRGTRIRAQRPPLPALPPQWRAASPEWSDSEPEPPSSDAESTSSTQPPGTSRLRRYLSTLIESDEDFETATQNSSHTCSSTEVVLTQRAARALAALAARTSALPPHLCVSDAALIAALPSKTERWQVQVLDAFASVVARNPLVAPHVPMLLAGFSQLTHKERHILLTQLEQPRLHLGVAALGQILRDDIEALRGASPQLRRRLCNVAIPLLRHDLLPLAAWLEPLAAVRMRDRQLVQLTNQAVQLCPRGAEGKELVGTMLWLARTDASTRSQLLLAMHRLVSLAMGSTARALPHCGPADVRLLPEHAGAVRSLLQQYEALAIDEREGCIAWLETNLAQAPLQPTLGASLGALAQWLSLAPLVYKAPGALSLAQATPLCTALGGRALPREELASLRAAQKQLLEHFALACRQPLELRHTPAVVYLVRLMMPMQPEVRERALEWICCLLYQKRFIDERGMALAYATLQMEKVLAA